MLLQQGQLVPIMHGTTFDALREVSPMLASRNGLSTAEEQHVRCRDEAGRSGRCLVLATAPGSAAVSVD